MKQVIDLIVYILKIAKNLQKYLPTHNICYYNYNFESNVIFGPFYRFVLLPGLMYDSQIFFTTLQ